MIKNIKKIFLSKTNLAFIIIAIFIVMNTGLYLYFENEKETLIENTFNQLSTVNNYKSNLVSLWLKERENDAKMILNVKTMYSEISLLINEPKNESNKKIIIDYYKSFKEVYLYENICLMDNNGKQILSVSEINSKVSNETIDLIQNNRIDNNIYFTNSYLENDSTINFDIIIPFVASNNIKNKAYQILKINPNRHLNNIISKIPFASKTAETILYELKNDSVYNLLPINQIIHKPMQLKIAMTMNEVMIVNSIKNKINYLFGEDYKTDYVLGHSQKINGINWYIITKINKDEVFRDYNKLALISIISFALLFFTITSLLLFIRKNEKKSLDLELYKNELELRQRNEIFKTILYSIGDGVITTDANGIITQMNPVAERLTEWRESEAIGQKLLDIYIVYNEDTGEEVVNPATLVMHTKEITHLSNTAIIVSKNNITRPISHSASQIRNENGEIIGAVLLVRDQTEEERVRKILVESEKYTNEILAKLNESQKVAQIGSFEIDLLTDKVWWSEEVYRIFDENVNSFIPDMNSSDKYSTPEVIDLNRNIISEAILNKINFLIEGEIITNNGNKKNCRIIGKAVYNSNGTPLKIVATIIDETEKKKYEKQLRLLSNSINQSPVSIIITDLLGRIEYVNPKFEEISGYTFDEVKGENTRFLKSGYTSLKEYIDLWDTITKGNIWHGEFVNLKKDKTTHWESASIAPIYDDKGIISNFVSVQLDITEIKKIQWDLILAKDKAEEMNKLKSSFLANMSHELRTPMIGILGFAKLIENESNMDEIKEMSNLIYESGKRLMDTLNSILNLSKIESGSIKIENESFDLIIILNELIHNFQTTAKENQLELIFNNSNKELLLVSDKRMLTDIINNLINNGLKFTENGTVTVTENILNINNIKYVKIEVIDTGIGIPEENMEFIFDEFRQGSEGIARNYDGSGLGLTISRKYAKLLNGDLSVQSKFKIGTTFTLILPIEEVKDIASEINSAPRIIKHNSSNDNSKINILYVEDDDINIIYFKKLCSAKYEVFTTRDSQNALDIISQNKIDIIFMDINLGTDESGIDITVKIKSIPEYQNIPIIACTAFAMFGDKKKFIALGCDDYLSKPFDKAQFKEILDNWL